MKKVYILAALLMATTSAHAGSNGVSVEIQGKRIELEMAPDCNSMACLKISAPDLPGFNKPANGGDSAPAPAPDAKRFNDDDRAGPGRPGPEGGRRFNDDDRAGPGRPEGGRRFNDDDRAGPGRPRFEGGRRFNDDDRASGPGRPDFKGGRRFNDDDDVSERAERPRYKGGYKSKRYNDDDNQASRPDRAPEPAPVPAAPSPAAPTDTATTPPAQTDAAPPAPAPAQVAAATPERERAPVAAEPESDLNSPIGVWAAEDNKGNVRIEQCGDNLCGFSEKSGEKVLINMKPQGSKWAGRIQDPDSGRKYDATIAMKGTKTLRVQGCAFGGMFCGGQTWKRVS